jgi:hypothetical protein
MPISRLLVAGLLLSFWVAPGTAQSVQSPQDHSPLVAPSPFFSQPLPGSTQSWLNFGTRIPLFAPKAQDGTALKQALPPLNLRRFHLFPTTPYPILLSRLSPLLGQHVTILTRNEEPCYAIRDYRFTREDPTSDATRLSGYSTCQPASQVHLMRDSSPAAR